MQQQQQQQQWTTKTQNETRRASWMHISLYYSSIYFCIIRISRKKTKCERRSESIQQFNNNSDNNSTNVRIYYSIIRNRLSWKHCSIKYWKKSFFLQTTKNWIFRPKLKARYSISNKKKAVPKRNVTHFDNKLLIPSSYHLNEKWTVLYQELLILCSGITRGVSWVRVAFWRRHLV